MLTVISCSISNMLSSHFYALEMMTRIYLAYSLEKSAHLTTVECCIQLINLWLTAIYSVLDRVTADT